MKLYAVKDIFLTLQGEGSHAGTRAVFLRFSGCNAWSGREEDRERDATRACCARWCDTDFVGGERLSDRDIVERVSGAWGTSRSHRVVVVTGGEPSLQLDVELVAALHVAEFRVHVETNGSRALPLACDWVTLSPKPPLSVVMARRLNGRLGYDEVKVVYPAVCPLGWEGYAPPGRRFVQPLDSAVVVGARRGPIAEGLLPAPLAPMPDYAAAVEFVLANPGWRLSVQAHKIAGVP